MKSRSIVAGAAVLLCSLAALAAPPRTELPYLEHFRALRAAKAVDSQPVQESERAKGVTDLVQLDPEVTGSGAVADRFGFSLAWSGDTLLVGAIGDEVVVPDYPTGVISGSVLVYRDVGGAWVREATLVPSPVSDDDRSGFSVALAGEIAIVGAPFALDGQGVERGAAWIFERTGSTWKQLAQLGAEDASSGDRFGWSVAIDGETVVVGAPAVAGGGAAYVFARSGNRWVQRAKLQGAQADAALGFAVGISGNSILAGAPGQQLAGAPPGSGAVFRYLLVGGNWGPAGTFGGSQPGSNAHFGHAIAYAGTRAVVGAPRDPIAGSPGRGSAYVFDIATDAVVERARMLASGGLGNDGFGEAVAIAATSVLVGAPAAQGGEGAAYVWVESGAGFSEQARLASADGGAPEFAGGAVALQGDRALLGAQLDDLASNRAQGSVQTFARSGGTWTVGPRLDTGIGASRELHGIAVAIDGDVALSGAFLDDTLAGEDDAGSATIWRRVGGDWTREATLEAPDAEPEDRFGISVALRDGRALVGAYWDIIGGRLNQGSAYVFRRDGSEWIYEAKLIAPDGATDDFFGYALAFDGETAVIGAPGQDAVAFDAGAAYVFRRSGATWTLQQKLADPGWSQEGAAGISVVLQGDLLAIGAPTGRIGTGPAHGLVHVYARDNQAWLHQDTLASLDAAGGDYFGGAVALLGDGIAVGAPGVDRPASEDAGQVVIFARNGGAWNQLEALAAPPPTTTDLFGFALAAAPDALLVGAPARNDSQLVDSGAAFLYHPLAGSWTLSDTLRAVEPQAYASFGYSVAHDGARAMVGEPDRSRDNPREGAAYISVGDQDLFADSFE